MASGFRGAPRSAIGKLRGAARYWLERYDGGADELAEDYAAFGQEDEAAEARGAREAPFAVYRCNWLTVKVWRDLWRRWRRDRTGQREALDLQQMESACRLRRVPETEWPEIYEGLLTMEDEVIGIWTESE